MQLQETAALRKSTDDSLTRSMKEEQDRQCHQVKQWLDIPTSDDQYRHRLTRSLCPDSGQWLLSDPRFDSWYSLDFCSTPLLWMMGIPGAGEILVCSQLQR